MAPILNTAAEAACYPRQVALRRLPSPPEGGLRKRKSSPRLSVAGLRIFGACLKNRVHPQHGGWSRVLPAPSRPAATPQPAGGRASQTSQR